LRGLAGQVGTLFLAIALAVAIWLYAVSQENPLITQEFPDRIPMTVRGLDAALQPVQDLGSQGVRVTLRAPRSAWTDLAASNFTASVDLTGYDEGSHDVPVDVEVNDPRVTLLSHSPPNLRIQLDPLVAKEMAVTVQVLDAPAFGYDWQTPIVTPPTVTVTGPATQVDLVDQINAPVYLLNAKSQVERTVELKPTNRQNQPVDGVRLSTTFANVVVPVEQWPGRKEVAVRTNLVGQPAPGYRLSTVRTEPSTVVLQGAADVLATVPGFVETEPLSIDGATTEVRRRLNLVVPAGVTVFDGNSVQAAVSISPVEGGATVNVRPIPQGLGTGLEATVSPDTVDVILSGPIPLLESLNTDDMFVFLDLSGLLPGTHVVTPRVVLPDGISAEGVLPETAEVVIVPLPADATPEATETEESGPAMDNTPLLETPEALNIETVEAGSMLSITLPATTLPATTLPATTLPATTLPAARGTLPATITPVITPTLTATVTATTTAELPAESARPPLTSTP
jgi:YbbR domain-containing protein